jgi:PAS domain S-box-containing protein
MDITKRKEAENEAKRKSEALEKSEKFLYSIVQNLPLEIIVQDAVTKDIVLENTNTFKLSGNENGIKKSITAGDIIKTNILPQSAELIKEADEKVLLTGQNITIAELPVKTEDGNEIIFRCLKAPIIGKNKKPQFIINMCEDVTEHIKARRELENANQLLLEAQEIGNVGIFERNLADHTIKVSKGMVKILGYELPVHYSEESRFDYIHPDDRP